VVEARVLLAQAIDGTYPEAQTQMHYTNPRARKDFSINRRVMPHFTHFLLWGISKQTSPVGRSQRGSPCTPNRGVNARAS